MSSFQYPLTREEPLLSIEDIHGPVGDVLNERVYITDPGVNDAVLKNLREWTDQDYRDVFEAVGLPLPKSRVDYASRSQWAYA